jgi:hypothetical protein
MCFFTVEDTTGGKIGEIILKGDVALYEDSFLRLVDFFQGCDCEVELCNSAG